MPKLNPGDALPLPFQVISMNPDGSITVGIPNIEQLTFQPAVLEALLGV